MFIEKWHIMDNDYVTFSEVSEDDATISEYTTIENGPSETKLATEITPEVRTAEKLNPYLGELPEYHQAYRHPSHCHPLLVVFNREDDIECSNKSCGRCISQNTTCFHCPLCDFDLCQWCFQLDYAGEDKSLPVNQYNYNRRIPVLKPLSVTV